MFQKFSCLGPLTKSGTNVIVGIVQEGIPCDWDNFRRVGIYVDLLKPEVQKFIKEVVPDLSTEECKSNSLMLLYQAYCMRGIESI